MLAERSSATDISADDLRRNGGWLAIVLTVKAAMKCGH